MMDQVEKARAFKALHVKGTPLVLWNIWDAGSAKAIVAAGAKAVATGSWSVAAAQGFADGQALPMAAALNTAAQIAGAVECPVTVDFEGGYAVEAAEVERNAAALIATGVVGLNFEDGVIGGEGLHAIPLQVARISAIRAAAQAAGVPLFINARTDVFFGGSDALDDVLERAAAYADAGADGLFVPGLHDLEALQHLTSHQSLPVNVMRMDGAPDIGALTDVGVARVSHGPGPYIAAMKALTGAASV